VIAGGVIDAKSRKPLAARIEIPGTGVAAVNADPATGAFKVENVPVGVYTVSATAVDYYPGSQTVAVEEDKVANASFELVSSAVAKVLLSGKVADKATGTPLAATVSFMGQAPDIAVDGGTGVYSAELPPGSYAVKVTSEGYLEQTAALIVEEGKPQIRNFDLVKEGMTITLKGIYFDVNKTTIKPASRDALADAAKILTDNPTIRVEIQGHTDSQGSDASNLTLSDGRAAAVVAYLVQTHGIDAARLTARGYGESMPIADNSTADGRSLNRRVEFVILSK
jgi:outer membrane protein OmpA-like peptidoglycan-associated protein